MVCSPAAAVDALAGYDALSAVPVFVGTNGVFTGGGVDALAAYDASSAVPVFVGTNGVFTGGGVNALGGYAALSAVATFFGDNNGAGGVFTGGGIDALGRTRSQRRLRGVERYPRIPRAWPDRPDQCRWCGARVVRAAGQQQAAPQDPGPTSTSRRPVPTRCRSSWPRSEGVHTTVAAGVQHRRHLRRCSEVSGGDSG